MLSSLALIAALELSALSHGQLARPVDAPTAAAGAQSQARGPAAERPDRVRTSDGREHVGRILGEAGNAFDFQDLNGSRYAIPVVLITAVERAGVPTLLPHPVAPTGDPASLREELTLSFDIFELERQRESLTYGGKALLMALGAATAVAGFAGLGGETGRVVGIVGLVEAGAGGAWLGVTWLRDRSIEGRIQAARERLGAMQSASSRREVRSFEVTAALSF